MRNPLLISIALAGTVAAFTPPGVVPNSSNNLTVAFGTVAALNGINLPRDATASAPALGTDSQLQGTFTLMMVDFDIPPANSSAPTSQRLHWMQSGLVSSPNTTTLAGKTVYPLLNPSNVSAFASYNQPSPPNRFPVSHRYVEFLLNTTNSATAASVLANVSLVRANFNAASAVDKAGVKVVAGNWFNVTNADALLGIQPTGSNATTTASSTGGLSSTMTGPALVPSGAAAGPLTWDGALTGVVGGLAIALGLL